MKPDRKMKMFEYTQRRFRQLGQFGNKLVEINVMGKIVPHKRHVKGLTLGISDVSKM